MRHRCTVLAAAVLACTAPPSDSLIFVDGRAVAAVGDSLMAFTRSGQRAITVRDRRTGVVYERAMNELVSPHHIERRERVWYVSDVRDGRWYVVAFDDGWRVARRIRVDTIASAPHQFASLPGGRLVLETTDGRLMTLDGDSLATFGVTEQGSRSGLLVGAHGGVLHAVPDRAITLYNAQGNVRWRLPWPWHEGAFVSDLAEDGQGRLHVLVSEDAQGIFVTYTLSITTGEVMRWSVPGSAATFRVERLGAIEPDSVERWLK